MLTDPQKILDLCGFSPEIGVFPPPAHPDPTVVVSENPATGRPLAAVRLQSRADYERAVAEAQAGFERWRMTPAPARGEVIRQIGEELRARKESLGALVSLEVGKIRSEGLGEIQECIDIADFSVGLSRQLYGLSMHSERNRHRMYEQWHPLGVVGIITAFNFPAAVWAWNAFVAAVCGDTMVWKPSLIAPLTALALNRIAADVARRNGFEGIFNLIIGTDAEVGHALVGDRRVPLISATGSCRMGKAVGAAVAQRLGRSLLELGGNNAIIVMPDADLDLAARAIAFGAVGTAGQRCTTTRRLLVHCSVAEQVRGRLLKAYASLSERIGDPLAEGTLVGPLVHAGAVQQMMAALDAARAQGGTVLLGGTKVNRPGHFVTPALVEAKANMPIVAEETFAPILYLIEVNSLDEAVAMNNGVAQGLSSAIFTDSVRSAETFLSHAGSDCGIANVNIGTSGAEIGGAFGGEKETGGGRESGSDAWKNYMRRQTCTINWGGQLMLAQGVRFD